jgi:hypothetical protein
MSPAREVAGDDGAMSSTLVGRLRLQFHDYDRFCSAELIRVFAPSTRAGLLAPRCEVTAAPRAVVAEMSSPSIVRGND